MYLSMHLSSTDRLLYFTALLVEKVYRRIFFMLPSVALLKEFHRHAVPKFTLHLEVPFLSLLPLLLPPLSNQA